MNIKLYNAANSQLRAKALGCLAIVESLLQDGAPVDDATVSKIVEQALELVQYEGAMHSLQQYFNAAPVAPPPAATQRPPSEPLVVTPEISSTYKKSLEEQKIKEAIEAQRKKKDE